MIVRAPRTAAPARHRPLRGRPCRLDRPAPDPAPASTPLAHPEPDAAQRAQLTARARAELPRARGAPGRAYGRNAHAHNDKPTPARAWAAAPARAQSAFSWRLMLYPDEGPIDYGRRARAGPSAPSQTTAPSFYAETRAHYARPQAPARNASDSPGSARPPAVPACTRTKAAYAAPTLARRKGPRNPRVLRTDSALGVSIARMRALPGLRRKMGLAAVQAFQLAHMRALPGFATQDGLVAVQASQIAHMRALPGFATQYGLAAVRAFQLRAPPALGLRCALIRRTYRISALSSAMPAPPAITPRTSRAPRLSAMPLPRYPPSTEQHIAGNPRAPQHMPAQQHADQRRHVRGEVDHLCAAAGVHIAHAQQTP